MAEFTKLHAYRTTPAEKAMLEQFIFGVEAGGENCAGAKLNPTVVGKSPVWIAQQAGFTVPADTSIILAEVSEVGPSEPLTREPRGRRAGVRRTVPAHLQHLDVQ